MSQSTIPAEALATPEALRVAVLFLNAEVAEIRKLVPQTAETAARITAVESLQSALSARLDTLSAMPEPDDSGPSWSWLNPAAWWERAGAPNAAAAFKVFRGIVLLGLVVWLVYRGVGFAERYVEAAEQTAAAATSAATRPPRPVEINIPERAVSPESDSLAP